MHHPHDSSESSAADERRVQEEWKRGEAERLAVERAEASIDAVEAVEEPRPRPWPWLALAIALGCGLVAAIVLNLFWQPMPGEQPMPGPELSPPALAEPEAGIETVVP